MSLGNLGDLGNLDLGQLQQYLPNLDLVVFEELPKTLPLWIHECLLNCGTTPRFI